MRAAAEARARSVGRVAVALLVAAGACAGGPSTPAALEPGGELCYRFQASEAVASLRLPWGMALSGAPVALREPGDRRAAATLDASGDRSLAPFASWRPLEADSVQVGPLVTGSLQLRLAVGDDGLRGIARSIGDVVRPGAPPRPAVEGVVAEPVACPVAH